MIGVQSVLGAAGFTERDHLGGNYSLWLGRYLTLLLAESLFSS